MPTLIRPGLRHRQHDLEERPGVGRAVDHRRLRHRGRQGLEERGEEEDGERQRVGDVDQDQPVEGVEQADVAHDEEQRHQRQEDRESSSRRRT